VEFEHAFQQSGFTTAYHLLILGIVLLAGFAGKDEQYRKFVDMTTSYLITFGPMALLVYVLYSVSRLS